MMEAAPAQRVAIPLQGRRDVRMSFGYLTAHQRADYYQAILRVFLRNARNYNSYLTLEDICAEVTQGYPEYTVDKCRVDLEQLCEWGNVAKTLDTDRRHTTIQSFLHPTVLYRITPLALAIEEFIVEQEQQEIDAGRGALRNADLTRLEDLFRDVDRTLASSLDESSGRALAETWRSLVELTNTITQDAYHYLSQLAVARQEAASADMDAYGRYKTEVVAYVQTFATHLEHVGMQIRSIFESWQADGRLDCLIDGVVRYGATPLLRTMGVEEMEEGVWAQVAVVANWFRGRDHIDRFGKTARNEISWVLERARLLAEMNNLQAGYLSDLNALAELLLSTSDVEEAYQLFAVAFAHATPRILPSHLTSADADIPDTWQGDPPAALTFQPIQRGATSTTRFVTPVRTWRDLDALRARDMDEHRERQNRIERIFSHGERAITDIEFADEVDVRIVFDIIEHCLQAVDFTWRADDGSLVTLLNPDDENLVAIPAPGGCYHVAPYLFRRVRPLTHTSKEGSHGRL